MASADDAIISYRERKEGPKKVIGTYEIEFPAEVVPDPKDSLEIDIQYIDASSQIIPLVKGPSVIISGPTLVSDTTGKMHGSGKLHAFVQFTHERFSGQLGLRLAWKHADASFERLDRREAGSPLNDASTAPVASDEPRLFLKIGQKTDAEIEPLPAGADATDDGRLGWRGFVVGRVLDHVHTHLRWGLGSYWYSFGGARLKNGVPMCELPDAELDELTSAELEECWAQHITESLTKAPYEGPGNFMAAAPDTSVKGVSSIHQQDATVFRKMREHRDGDAAFYPIIFACQQLVSASVFFRGHFEIADNPADAVLWDPTANVTGAQRKIGAKINPVTGTKLEENGWLRPGLFLFRGKADGSAIRHVGVILRANRGTKKYQLLDTGGWTTNEFGGGGAFDSSFMSTNSRHLHSVLAPPVDDDTLRKGIRALRRARPLAAAQLVILRRGVSPQEKSLWWASPVLHMHEGNGGARMGYPLTRLIASLRDIPFAKELDVRWQVSIPLDKNLPPAMDGVVPWWRTPGATDRPAIEIGSKTDGSVDVIARVKQNLGDRANPHTLIKFSPKDARKDFDAVPALDQRKTLASKYPELADMSGVEIPEYFEGTP